MASAVSDVRATQAIDVWELEQYLGVAVRNLDPDAVTARDSERMWNAFMGIARLANAGATLTARRVEACGSWKRTDARSAAAHLANSAGISISESRLMLQTSKRVQTLARTAAAMRAGSLSMGKAHAIADAAALVPEAEAELLDGAEKKSLSDVREDCLKVKAKHKPEDRHKRIHAERRFTQHRDAEGAWKAFVRGTVENQAIFNAAHQPILNELFEQARKNGKHEPREAYAFDALIEMARRAMGGGTATDEPTKKRKSPKFLGIIRADDAALRRGHVEGDEICEIRGLGPIPVSVARELLGDAVLKLVLTKGVDVANVTHLGRSPTVAQQVALWWRSPTCTVEGCNRTQFVQNDHREDWHRTKHTVLDEIDPLCTHHHDLKTHNGWALIAGTGKRAIVPPHDPRHPNHRGPPTNR